MRRARYAKNPEHYKAKARLFYQANKDQHRASGRKWEVANRERENARKKAWRDRNPEMSRDAVKRSMRKKRAAGYKGPYDPAKIRARYHADPKFKVTRLLRARLRLLVKRKGGEKSASTMTLAGCTLPFLLWHLESLFQDGMTWENHGMGPGFWNIDHVRPCASFDLTNSAHQAECFHFSNLQPLWYEDNAAKGSKVA